MTGQYLINISDSKALYVEPGVDYGFEAPLVVQVRLTMLIFGFCYGVTTNLFQPFVFSG